jgi:hypothetical protein
MSAIGSPKTSRTSSIVRGVSSTTVVQEGEDLRALVVARAAQHVGHRLGVRQALAGAHADALVGVDQEGDRFGACGAR